MNLLNTLISKMVICGQLPRIVFPYFFHNSAVEHLAAEPPGYVTDVGRGEGAAPVAGGGGGDPPPGREPTAPGADRPARRPGEHRGGKTQVYAHQGPA